MAPSRIYLKGPAVKNLLLNNDASCEEKLEQLSEMVGIPYQKPQSNEIVDSNANDLVTVITIHWKLLLEMNLFLILI